MAQEYIAVKQKNEIGLIALNKSVFTTMVKIAVEEEENVELAENNTPFKSSCNAKIVEDQLVINLDVKVKYSANVNDVCAKLQNKIFESIEHMSEYTPDVIDIKVVGFIF
ncbi:MAG: Asp23/Gls24 family envelope stress response protein [Erysipelotrichaceae bacterium]